MWLLPYLPWPSGTSQPPGAGEGFSAQGCCSCQELLQVPRKALKDGEKPHLPSHLPLFGPKLHPGVPIGPCTPGEGQGGARWGVPWSQGTSVPQLSPVLRLGMLTPVVGGDQSQPIKGPT